MAHQMVLAPELGIAVIAVEARRYTDTLVAHVSLQVPLAQVAFVADRAAEPLHGNVQKVAVQEASHFIIYSYQPRDKVPHNNPRRHSGYQDTMMKGWGGLLVMMVWWWAMMTNMMLMLMTHDDEHKMCSATHKTTQKRKVKSYVRAFFVCFFFFACEMITQVANKTGKERYRKEEKKKRNDTICVHWIVWK